MIIIGDRGARVDLLIVQGDTFAWIMRATIDGDPNGPPRDLTQGGVIKADIRPSLGSDVVLAELLCDPFTGTYLVDGVEYVFSAAEGHYLTLLDHIGTASLKARCGASRVWSCMFYHPDGVTSIHQAWGTVGVHPNRV